MIKEKWMEILKKFRGSNDYWEPAQFDSNLDKYFDHIVERTLEMKKNLAPDITVKDQMAKFRLHDTGNPNRSNIMSMYKDLYDNYNILTNIRKQEVWADYSDRNRFLVYRVLTTIGIAGVVLLTYWIAHKLEIPLPMLKLQ